MIYTILWSAYITYMILYGLHNWNWGVIGIWFSGFATLSAVVLALYLQHFYEHRQRPTLSIKYDKRQRNNNRYIPPSFTAGYALSKTEGIPAKEELWLRLQVENTSSTAAKDVELRFMYIQQEGNEDPESRPAWWFKVSNLNAISIIIPPKFTQHFDIAYVKHVLGTPNDLSFYLAIVRPDLRPWSEEKARIEMDAENNLLKIGCKYTLQFAVLSSNADARYYQISVQVEPQSSAELPPDKQRGEEFLKKCVNVSSFCEIKYDS